MSSRTWQRRYFVLDDDEHACTLRYMRLDAGGRLPLTHKHVEVDLRKVKQIERASDREIHLISGKNRRHKLRCEMDIGDPWVMQRWFDEIVIKIDELQDAGSGGNGADGDEDDDEEDHENWWAPPQTALGFVSYAITLPELAAT